MMDAVDTGHYDRHVETIYEGDYITIPEHNSSQECPCQHMLKCRAEWDEELGRWMLKFAGRIIAPLTLAQGWEIHRNDRKQRPDSYRERMANHFKSGNATEQEWAILGQVFLTMTCIARHEDPEEMPVLTKVALQDLNIGELIDFNKKVNINS